ncbi:MAG TPA: hypothetical protein VK435_04005 [Thermodesulfovibrionales bacterium]|nr:hypothetical protein [Thermodesulfovibrionales bacterium]
MIIPNEAVKELIAEIPEGHRHIRTSIVLEDGTELTFQEATIAGLVRAYVTVKTHPSLQVVRLTGRRVRDRKQGYAEWQLTEDKGA